MATRLTVVTVTASSRWMEQALNNKHISHRMAYDNLHCMCQAAHPFTSNHSLNNHLMMMCVCVCNAHSGEIFNISPKLTNCTEYKLKIRALTTCIKHMLVSLSAYKWIRAHRFKMLNGAALAENMSVVISAVIVVLMTHLPVSGSQSRI